MSTSNHWLLALALASVASCAEAPPEGPRIITTQRTWTPIGHESPPGRSSAERFGYERSRPSATAEHRGTLAWETPEGWTELPGSSMRQANFLVAGDEQAECYLTVLPGDAGGLLANVNRWRSQMSLEPTDSATLAGALRAPFLGMQALVVDFSGTWSGMSGNESGEDYRLIGLLATGGGQSYFLKMVGPAELISEQKRTFLALAASFHEDHSGHDHGGDAPQSDPHAGLPMDNSDPHAGLPMGNEVVAGSPPGAMSWTAPEGWRQAAPRPMRDVTFNLGPDDATECYVAQLGGNAGGVFANINRWRGQMGQPALSSEEFGELERIDMLGGEGVLVEVSGSFSGMAGEKLEEATLLGAVCPLPGRVVFVKLIGPSETVAGVRDDFVTFCRSLGEGS